MDEPLNKEITKMHKYIKIKNDEFYGHQYNALLSNLGYCLSSTTDDDFYKNIYQAGIDFLNILKNSTQETKLLEILNRGFEKSKKMGCGCTKNQYDINGCHIMHITSMLYSLKDLEKYRSECVNCVFEFFKKLYREPLAEQSVSEFYAYYFLILKESSYATESMQILSKINNPRIIKHD